MKIHCIDYNKDEENQQEAIVYMTCAVTNIYCISFLINYTLQPLIS